MIEWRLFEVKQHKYKLVLGWVTIWWVVLLIQRRKACYDHNINQEPNTGGGSYQSCKQWFRRLTSSHNFAFLRLLLSIKITFVMLSTWYCTWCCMIFSLRKMFLPSAATLCSSLFFIICHTLCMALNVYEFLKLKVIFLKLSTWTASWSFLRWPLRFTSSSHSLQV